MESTTINNAIKEVREFFNEIRGSLSREEINRMRKELYKKEAVYNILKEKAEDFPRGDKHFKHVPPPTYLICISPKGLHRSVLFKLYDHSNL